MQFQSSVTLIEIWRSFVSLATCCDWNCKVCQAKSKKYVQRT